MSETKESPVKTEPQGQIFALKTTSGQESSVANLIYNRATSMGLPIYSVMVTDNLRGYAFVEAAGPHFVDEITAGARHARQRIAGLVKVEELERYLITKPLIDEISLGDTVEVTAGPLKGMKAKITKIDKGKSEVTLELLESTTTLPITVHADYVRVIASSGQTGAKQSR